MTHTLPAIETDEYGFLTNPAIWTEAVADELARRQGILFLTPLHERIIACYRAYHRAHGIPPWAGHICESCRVTIREFYALFPKGPLKGAAVIAGLPRPPGCPGAF